MKICSKTTVSRQHIILAENASAFYFSDERNALKVGNLFCKCCSVFAYLLLKGVTVKVLDVCKDQLYVLINIHEQNFNDAILSVYLV